MRKFCSNLENLEEAKTPLPAKKKVSVAFPVAQQRKGEICSRCAGLGSVGGGLNGGTRCPRCRGSSRLLRKSQAISIKTQNKNSRFVALNVQKLGEVVAEGRFVKSVIKKAEKSGKQFSMMYVPPKGKRIWLHG
jgi:hypothetical protein